MREQQSDSRQFASLHFESFPNWLNQLSHEHQLAYTPVIVHRAVMRSLPTLSRAFRVMENQAAQASALWALASTIIFQSWMRAPETNFGEAAGKLRVKNLQAFEFAHSHNKEVAATLQSAAELLNLMKADTTQILLRSALLATQAAASGQNREGDLWQAISSDARALEAGISKSEMMARPLWGGEPPPEWMLDWEDLKQVLLRSTEDPEESQNWDVWIQWFDARITGRTGSWGLLSRQAVEVERQIALGGHDPGFWDRQPTEINSDIAGWLRELKWKRGSGITEALQKQGTAIKAPKRKERPKAKTSESVKTTEVRKQQNAGTIPEAGLKTGTPLPSEPLPVSTKRADLEPLPDTVDGNVDHLGRANIAYALASRINEVWDQMNKPSGKPQGAVPGFVIHIDAPWGGGKSTFAEHIAQILNPYIIKGPLPAWLKALPIGKGGTWPERFRRPWHIVRFNAWQHQHVTPPWWVFYETIRETVTRQGAEETNHQEAALPPPASGYAYGSGVQRWIGATVLGLREYAWRLFSPSFWFALLPLVLTVFAIYLLVKFGVIQTVQKDGKFEIGIPSNATGFIATTAGVLLGGGAALWRLWAAFTQTLLPGTPDAAKNFSLGSGDPLKRMKAHFVGLMQKVHRPVLVIVDDLDRCEPAFVVELVRGMQTILASPRVVYLLLGDRDWIEQSFTEVHKAMKGVEVGPEHRFGGRFVEKAIQFSMVLPDVSEAGRQDYVRQLLTTSGKPAAAQPVTAPPSVLDSTDVPESQRKIVDNLKADAKEVLETDDYQERERKAKVLADKYDLDQLAVPKDAFNQEMAQKLFFRAATDSTAEQATRHMIEGMASILPANPRQIKRIINTLSLLGQVLRIKDPAKRPGSADWQLLARWVVLMVEWPRSWFTLTRYPGLADVALAISQGKTEDEIAAIEMRVKGLGFLPATGTRPLAKLIAANPTVMRALDFLESDWVHKPIMAQEIEWLRVVMPAASGQVLQPPQQEKPASSDPVGATGKTV